MTKPLALASSATIRHESFGNERQSIIIADDALADPDAVVEIAARQTYQPVGRYYPGVRAAVPAAAALELAQPIAALIMQVFGLFQPPRFEECYLSIVSTSPAELSPQQRMPHFDGTETGRLAVLLYLDKAEQGGTAFYRHRSTGFESISEARLHAYDAAVNQETRQHGLPKAGYVSGDTPLFEQVHSVNGNYNRAIFYRGNTLHCGMLDAGFVPNPDPKRGRLTLNLFLVG